MKLKLAKPQPTHTQSKSYRDAQFMHLNKENSRFPHTGPASFRPNLMDKRPANKQASQDSGFMGLFMPFYTAIIILLFVYTLIKVSVRSIYLQSS